MNAARKPVCHLVIYKEGDGEQSRCAVSKDEFTIGRTGSADVCIANPVVSQKHVLVRIVGGQVIVRDLGSANGTYIGNIKLDKDKDVRLSGSIHELRLGKSLRLTVAPGAVESLPETEGHVPPKQVVAANVRSVRAPKVEVQSLGLSQIPDSAQAAVATPGQVPEPTASVPIEKTSTQMSASDILDVARAEVAEFKKKTIAEIETIQADAVRFAEMLKEDSRKEAQALMEGALKQVEEIKARAQADAAATRTQSLKEADDLKVKVREEIETLKHQSHEELDTHRAQALKDIELLKANAQEELEALRSQIVQEKSEQRALKSETEKLSLDTSACRVESDRMKSEHQDQERRLREAVSEHERLLKALESERDRRDQVAREHDDFEQKISECRKTLHLLTQDRDECESDLRRKKNQLESLMQELAESTVRLNSLKESVSNQESSLRSSQEANARERAVQEAEERKRKALYEALDGEHQVRRLHLEAALGQIELKKCDAEREVQKIVAHGADVELASSKRKAEADQHVAAAIEKLRDLEADSVKARDRLDRFKSESERLQSKIEDQEKSVPLFKKKTEEATAEMLASHEALRLARAEVEAFRKNFEEEVAKQRLDLAQEAETTRAKVASEMAALAEAARAERNQESDRHRESLKKEFLEKGKMMELELAEVKLKELKIIEQMREEERKAARARHQATEDIIISSAIQLSLQKPLAQAEVEFREAIRAAFERHAAPNLSLEAADRTRKYWRKMAIRASVPAGIAVFFLVFPGFPGAIKDYFTRTVASGKNDSGFFLEQIRQRGMKFQPEMDQSYRATYSENILYLEGYAEMKLDEDEQKTWTLTLNDFIVGHLGLSDRVIPDFISAEAVMLLELLKIRGSMLPQFKDQGLARLVDTEKQLGDKLSNLLQSPESYQKFRHFEKSYYHDYMRRRKTAGH